MPNVKRIVIPDMPHHIRHRGNLGQTVFFRDADRRLYLQLLTEHTRHHGISVQAYCLMTNHVHLIVTPHDINGLHHAFERIEGDYARALHIRLQRRGHLWERRYRSSSMDENHFWAGMVYVEQNPVRACLVEHAEAWRWSSARAHLEDQPGDLLDFTQWRRRFTPESWFEQLRLGVRDAALVERIREATRTGRPSASDDVLEKLEQELNRKLRPGAPGRPKKAVQSEGCRQASLVACG